MTGVQTCALPISVLVLVYPRSGDVAEPPEAGLAARRFPRSHRSDLEFTALRETEEELGIPAAHVRILGALGEVATLGGSFRITPYVGLLPYEPVFRPQPGEVATVIEVSLAHLQNPRIFGEVERQVGGIALKVLSCDLGGYRIIGPTAQAVKAFLATDYPAAATRALYSV